MRAVGRSRSEVELGSDLARPCLVPDRVGACRVVRESDIDAPPLPRPQRPASPRVVRLTIRICYRELRFAADRPRLLDRMRLGAGSLRTNSLISVQAVDRGQPRQMSRRARGVAFGVEPAS